MMPRGLIVVFAAMSLFAVVVLGVLAWAGFSGRAGSQRGLVIFNETGGTIVVSFADGQAGAITPDDERTFVVKRERFPSDVTVSSGGEVVHVRNFEYQAFVDADFRLSFDARGFYPTSIYRDTPVPSPTQGG